jgi:hypothetical protein
MAVHLVFLCSPPVWLQAVKISSMQKEAGIKAALTKRSPKSHTQNSIQQDAAHPSSSSDFNFELSEML